MSEIGDYKMYAGEGEVQYIDDFGGHHMILGEEEPL